MNKDKINVVIVEDEETARLRVFSIIHKQKDYQIVGFFENGLDALEGIIQLKPDILVTDINMPYLDGISLVERIKNEIPYLKSIIITGFDEFDYAKRALELEVVRFLTKPIIESELIEALKIAKDKLHQDAQVLKHIEELETLKKNNLVLLKESFFNKLLKTDHLSNDLRVRIGESINLEYETFQIGIIDFNTQIHDVELELIKVVQPLLENQTFSFDFTIKNEQLIILFKSNNLNASMQIEQAIKRLITNHR